jgi:hypothetical protein
LFTLPFEFDLIPVLHAPLNIDLENLGVGHESVSAAVGAHFSECFSFALALGARLLHLHLHHAHIHMLSDLAGALTSGASFHLAALST